MSYFICLTFMNFLARLFQRKSQARSLSLLSSLACKIFNVVHYSKSVKGINTKLGMLAPHDKILLQDKGNKSETYSFGVMPLFNLKF